MDGVERFQNQMEIVDLIDIEDAGQITAKVKECIEKDSGALEEKVLILDLDQLKSREDENEE